MIRVVSGELYRIDASVCTAPTPRTGALSPVFYSLSDRELIHDITDHQRPRLVPHPRCCEDLPRGWEAMVRLRLHAGPAASVRPPGGAEQHHEGARGVGALTLGEAVEWGIAAPDLRASHKKRASSGYKHFEFEIPTATGGDYDALVRIEEMRQSLRIIRQCLDNMPAAPSARPPPTQHDARHRVAHQPLPGRQLGTGHPARRGLGAGRVHARRHGLLLRQRRRHQHLPHGRPTRRRSAPAGAALLCLGLEMPTSSPSWAASTSSWPTWTAEGKGLSDEEHRELEGAAALPLAALGGHHRAQDRAASPALGLGRGAGRPQRLPARVRRRARTRWPPSTTCCTGGP